jgi:broad specificity phosphatase PhoE
MPELILIKHSLPEMLPGIPAREWHLSPEGRQRCQPLADELKSFTRLRIFSSLEPKALETAEIIARYLGSPIEARAGLHEHSRRTAEFLSQKDFRASVKRLFIEPGELVFGEETAFQAQERFSRCVAEILSEYPAQNLAIVAHGTVISLFIARHCLIEPFHLWQRLELPSFVILSLPELRLLSITENILKP